MARDQEATFVVLHGFLGNDQSFSALQELGYKIFPLELRPSRLGFPKWSELIAHVTKELLEWSDQPHYLMGYSMGGRILLETVKNLDLTNCKGIDFISSYAGIYEGDEIHQRLKFNEQCLERLKKNRLDGFLEFWNSLPLFSHDDQKEDLQWDLLDIEHFFKHWAPASEPDLDLSPELQRLIIHHHGQYDLKYKEQGRRFKTRCPLISLQEIKGRSHRLLGLEDLKQILNASSAK